MKKYTYKEWDCVLVKRSYSNGNLAIELTSEEEGSIAVATVNLGDKLPEGQAYIKNYSENEGMLDFLIDAGVAVKLLGYERCGYAVVPLCIIDVSKLNEE